MIKNTLLIVLLLFLTISCKETPNKIEGKRIDIDENITSNNAIEDFIAPYKTQLNKNLDSVISYAPETYSKTDGELNTAIGNLMADAVFSESNPIFNKRTGKNIDLVLLNHGGIRSIISQGNITSRTAYEVMPFENSVVVAAIKGKQVSEMISFLAKAKRAHPVSKQLEILLDDDFNIKKALIKGKPVSEDKMYYIATNDYLYNGGDRMSFFHPSDSLYVLDYKIRNVLIDYFKKTDTIKPKIDNRFTKLPSKP
ncbi:5'-nucleotidase C-terminal domain-containing protein [Winogradskyella sp.]|jgi:5'-nucleotidase|uniref:5'-nucleotidase C-terminal domain-containing protein n=1 Tax=Winogradskyella sp. TaxID=1883156 RepID=UPI0025CC6F78|nr:5'-nucleotidase C-terminal domain-containing protein [Winogradskyella sp.]MCT4628655.1 5'-nucleotidase C-terminal domain-containing protein [Winogradskyella sp.]